MKLPDLDAMRQPAATRRFAERIEREVTKRIHKRTNSGPHHAGGYFDIPLETTLTAFLLGYQLGSGKTAPSRPRIGAPTRGRIR